MLLLCNKEMKNDNINVPKNVENIIKWMDFIEGLVVMYIMKDVVIKISDNLIMLKSAMFTGTVSNDIQKNKYAIPLIVISLLLLGMVYYKKCFIKVWDNSNSIWFY